MPSTPPPLLLMASLFFAPSQILLDWELADDVTALDIMRKVRPQLPTQTRVVIVSGNERASLAPTVALELDSLGVAVRVYS